jgi:hypothetical protein
LVAKFHKMEEVENREFDRPLGIAWCLLGFQVVNTKTTTFSCSLQGRLYVLLSQLRANFPVHDEPAANVQHAAQVTERVAKI